MSAYGKDLGYLTQYIRKLRGGSQPILARASDGQLYVVKFTNIFERPNLPFNESMGAELYRLFNLCVPSWRPLLVTSSFLDHNPDCWNETAEGKLRPDEGLCFASRFLGGDGIRLLELLPGAYLNRVRNSIDFWAAWLIDVCADHASHRVAIFTEERSRSLHAHFVSHCHMFGGLDGNLKTEPSKTRYLDERIYPDIGPEGLNRLVRRLHRLDVDGLWRESRTLPVEWLTDSALCAFQCTLNRLADLRFLQKSADAIFDTKSREFGLVQFGKRRSVFRAGAVSAFRSSDSTHASRSSMGL